MKSTLIKKECDMIKTIVNNRVYQAIIPASYANFNRSPAHNPAYIVSVANCCGDTRSGMNIHPAET